MSKGAGKIERRIEDLLAATRDRALTVDDITDAAFALAGAKPTRAQRLSATRAAHRVLRRTREKFERISDDRSTEAARDKLHDEAYRVGLFSRIYRGDTRGTLRAETDFWCTTTIGKRLYFHPPDVPVQVWAVSIGKGGITWVEAEVLKVTNRNVMVRYNGETARLDRESLWYACAWWRGVRFVSSRTGRIASELDEAWWRRYGARGGAVPPSMQMPLEQARLMLGLPVNYNRDDVIAGFRRAAFKAHPDQGGAAEMFRKLVEARDRLLAALGTSAPPPKPPDYAPKGARVVYRRIKPQPGHCWKPDAAACDKCYQQTG